MLNDKTSKSFIPIAEEYIKSGMLDEAIDLLKEGLQQYPNYLGARVSLGKAYLEKGMINEAMKEFENVVQVSPDNLFAHRKLALIYKEIGRIEDAIKACETVLVFSPKDKDITELLSNLIPPLSTMLEKSSEIDFTSGWEVATERDIIPTGVGDEFTTETMGDLLVTQGEIEKGVDIYSRILEKDPDNDSVRGKLSDLGGTGGLKEKQINRLQEFLNKVQKNKR